MSREQWYSACKRVHNFVQIEALRGGKWGLADIRKPDDGLSENVPVLHQVCAIWATAQVKDSQGGI